MQMYGLGAGVLIASILTIALLARAHRAPTIPTVAFIPQTAGAMLWEVEHFGATQAAEKLKYRLYWNAPTSESDIAGQVLLVDRVTRGKYQGLVIAPNHPLFILTPLRRAIAEGLPVVVVSAPIDLPANSKLGYIVNDDEKMGELAAAETARLLGGKGSVALIGLARYAPGITERVRGAERFLAERFPGIQIINRSPGAYSTPLSESLAGGLLDSHSELKAVLTFTAPSTRGVLAALRNRSKQKSIVLIGCEQDFDLLGSLDSGELAAVVAEDTYRMGYEAVALISASLAGKTLPARSVVPPLLLTKANMNSPEARRYTSLSK